MKRWVFGAAVLFFVSGCLETREHLTISKDGSGTLAVTTVVPEGTIQFIDATLGAMMKSMQSMAASMASSMGAAGKSEEAVLPASMAEEVFANPKEIEKKAQKAGLKISFKEFEKKHEGKDLRVQYVLTYDDINRLLASGIMGSKGELQKDDEGHLVFLLKSDPKKTSETKSQVDQMRQQCGVGTGDGAADPAAQKMIEAMKRFKIEFLVTMPNDIIGVGGQFERQDSSTAYLGVSGDLLADPALRERMEAMDKGPHQVSCSLQGITFEPQVFPPFDEEVADVKPLPAVTAPSPVKTTWSTGLPSGTEARVRLRAGNVVEGKIVQESADSVQIETAGIPITYFKDEIEKVEAKKA